MQHSIRPRADSGSASSAWERLTRSRPLCCSCYPMRAVTSRALRSQSMEASYCNPLVVPAAKTGLRQTPTLIAVSKGRTQENRMTYSPEGFDPLTFFDVMPRFRDGSDTPRAYLERCLAVIADREPVVKAWVVLNPSGAREAADASTERYRRGR